MHFSPSDFIDTQMAFIILFFGTQKGGKGNRRTVPLILEGQFLDKQW